MKLKIIKFISDFSNYLLDLIGKILFRRLKDNKPKNILIYRIGNIGDIVCSIPSFIAIREYFPKAKITLLSSPGRCGAVGAKELVKDSWYLDGLRIYHTEDINSFYKKVKFLKELRKEKYDLFVTLPNNLIKFTTLARNMIFAKLIGVSFAIGFKLRIIRLFNKIQPKNELLTQEVEALLKMLNEYGVKNKEVKYGFPISGGDRARIEELLRSGWTGAFAEGGDHSPLVVIHPWAKRPTNRWPIERFIEVGQYLNVKYNARIIITGDSKEAEKAEVFKRAIGANVLIAAGKLTLLQTAELLKRCHLLVSNDTGIVHIASAVSLPIAAVFSARDVPGRWYPWGDRNIVLRGLVDCEGCFKEHCDTLDCLKSINTDKVIEACQELIRKNSCVKI